jgi:hypothetical protein
VDGTEDCGVLAAFIAAGERYANVLFLLFALGTGVLPALRKPPAARAVLVSGVVAACVLLGVALTGLCIALVSVPEPGVEGLASRTELSPPSAKGSFWLVVCSRSLPTA